MNMEQDVAPTGFYDHLPRMVRKTHRRRVKKVRRTLRRKTRGGVHPLQSVLDKLSTIMGEAGGEDTMKTPKRILATLKKHKVALPYGTNVGQVHSAVKKAILQK
jgi:hypothetical protein